MNEARPLSNEEEWRRTKVGAQELVAGGREGGGAAPVAVEDEAVGRGTRQEGPGQMVVDQTVALAEAVLAALAHAAVLRAAGERERERRRVRQG